MKHLRIASLKTPENSDPPNTKIYILKNDQTKRQQLLEYELRKERKERILNKEDVIIYDGKVILRSQHPNYDPSKQRQYVDSRTKETSQTQPTA